MDEVRKIVRDSEGNVLVFFTSGYRMNASEAFGSVHNPSHDVLLWEK